MATSFDPAALEIAAESVDECFFLLRRNRAAAAPPAPPRLADIRVQAWTAALESDSSGSLRRRLVNEQLAPGNLMAVLRRLPPVTPAAGWAHNLKSVLSGSLAERRHAHIYPFVHGRHSFGHILWPICIDALEQLELRVRVPTSLALGLQEWLLARLVEYSAPALYSEFAIFRNGHQGARAGTGVYEQFCRAFSSEGLRDFLIARPALARIITTIVTQWVAAAAEFLERLGADFHDLLALLGRSDADVESLVAGLSDPHGGGRAVIRVNLSAGESFYYKPRPLTSDQMWLNLMRWLRAAGGPPIDRHPLFLCKGDYGWQHSCERFRCGDPKSYFRNLGYQLALFRTLGSSDMHHENVIAAGDFPVFVDLETLVSPTPRVRLSANGALHSAELELVHSVWKTGVLPDATLLPTGNVMAFGALAERPGNLGRSWVFENANTDEMAFVCRSVPPEDCPNLPIGEAPISPSEYASELVDGFHGGLALIRERWTEFLGSAEPWTGMPIPSRAIFRPTAVYAAALHSLRDPRRLRNGIEWSSRLEFEKGDLQQLGILGDPALIAAERRALLNGDIPFFVTCGIGAVADAFGCIVENAVEPTSVASPVLPITDQEMERDERLIRWSLGGKRAAQMEGWGLHPGAPSEIQALVRGEASRIVDVVARRAVVSDDGAAWWGRVSLLTAPSIAVLGAGLYDGLSGIGLFLAAAGDSLGSESAQELAVKTFQTVRMSLRRHRPSAATPQRTIGFASGMAGISYAALCSARFWDQEDRVDLAREAGAFLTAEIIDSDQSFDLLNGAAGALITCLHLWEATGEDMWLAKAELCGDRLLQAHEVYPFWTSAGRVSVGMAHGLCGIGFALCRLARAGDRPDCSKLGLAALERADTAYSDPHSDWAADLVEGPEEPIDRKYWNRWCHGAVGVGLAWREQLRERPRTQVDILNRAVGAVLEKTTRPLDNLCCGNAGQIDFLLEMAADDPTGPFYEIALRRAAWLLGKRKSGGYACDEAQDEAVLGMFPGLSGIGYVLLRLLAPERLPSILALKL